MYQKIVRESQDAKTQRKVGMATQQKQLVEEICVPDWLGMVKRMSKWKGVCDWVSEWLSEWASEWVSECEGAEL